LQDRLDSSIGNDPCPSGQWPDQTGMGGSDLSQIDTPTSGTCVFNKDWASPHFSYRGGPTQPWFVISFFDTRTPGPEYFTGTSDYVAPTCTQTDTTTSGTCWYQYEDEIVAVNIATDMNAAGTAPLATVYRLAQARSRSLENFWVQVTATINHVPGSIYAAFNSNMANHSGCTSNVQNANGCGDVYIISGTSGIPLF
jgi:hypothetical protein